jgi:hypothetical protein
MPTGDFIADVEAIDGNGADKSEADDEDEDDEDEA